MPLKKILACTSAMVLCCEVVSTPQVAGAITPMVVSAEDKQYQYNGSCGANANFSFDETTGTLTISGTGDIRNYDYEYFCIYAPWFDYRENIKTVVIEDGITSIGDYAFYDCTSLTKITIPDSIDYIGDYAFCNCTSLTEITIPNSPNNVTYIGEYSFAFTSLTEVTIPNSVIVILKGTFASCELLTNVIIPNTVTSIDKDAFEDTPYWNNIKNSSTNGCIIINNILYDYIGEEEKVNIPNGVTSIGEWAFYLTSLTEVTIPNSVTSIYEDAFNDIQLTDVYFQGTEDEWNSIEIDNTNECLINATIHFLDNDTSPIEENPTTTDVLKLKKYILGITKDITGLDFNTDGKINILDLNAILNKSYK